MTLDLGRIQALCFDVDGTLSDTDDVWTARLAQWMRPLRFAFPQRDPLPAARWTIMSLESPGNLAYHFLDWLTLDDEAARLYNALSRRRPNRRKRSFQIIPRVPEMLCSLAPRYPMAVVSAGSCSGTHAFLDYFDLAVFFRAVATSQTCAYTKPFPHPLRWAAEKMGVAPENCLMIGDTTVDIRAGKAAGAQTVGVLCGFGTEAELRRAGADLILPATADLVPVLCAAVV